MNTTLSKTALEASESLRRAHRGQVKDALISRFIQANGAIAIIVLFLIFAFLLKDALPTFEHISLVRFLFGKTWQPEFGNFGILPLLMGSLFVTAGAIIVAVPLGIACSIYLAEIAPAWMREILKPTIEVLAGIPSVVIGFLGLTVASPIIMNVFHLATGLTALTGAIMLAFMAMPTIISISEDAIASVPKAYRDGSLALGATHWETICGVIVPAAKSGIVAACMLGVGRAIGETMTVLMVAGNAANLPSSAAPKAIWAFLTGPVRTMTATIAMETGETVQHSLHYSALLAIGLMLFLITFLINMAADLIIRKGRS